MTKAFFRSRKKAFQGDVTAVRGREMLALLYCNTLCQIAWLVNVQAFGYSNMIGKQL